MKYSPLTIHCASMCLDILTQHKFMPLTHIQIDDMRMDIHAMIQERAETLTFPQFKLEVVVEAATSSVLSVLHQACAVQHSVEASWILNTIETQVTNSIQSSFYS